MRRRMLEALTYPRMHVMRAIDQMHCPNDGYFASADEICRDCTIGKPCHWLSCHDSFSELARRPMHTIHASLLYCIEFMSENSRGHHHNLMACTCQDCSWVRDARRLAREYSNQQYVRNQAGEKEVITSTVF